MTKIRDVVKVIEHFAPPGYQESYDNSGLQIGSFDDEVKGVLLSVDVTEEVLDEAVVLGINLIISHHPVIFQGLKQISGKNYTERIVMKAIKSEISIYSCHTNIDNVLLGVSHKMGEKLQLKNRKVLKPISGNLIKLVVFVPVSHAEGVQTAILEAGAGHVGNYDFCSFSLSGEGTFRALDEAHPFVGDMHKLHKENEIRLETIFPTHLKSKVETAMKKVHPYEEIAFDLYPLKNEQTEVGAGLVGELELPVDARDFLELLKSVFEVPVIRHTALVHKNISKVALCGGSGSFLLKDAQKAQADIFISGDFKYHQFFDAEKSIIIADIGHFESEQFTLEIFYDLLVKNFSNFAVRFTKVKTNPIYYF